MSKLRSEPAAALRHLALAGASLAALGGLLLSPGAPPVGVLGGTTCVALLLALALRSWVMEAHPEELDFWPAQRARRLAPTVVGVVLVGLALFPTLAAWSLLWLVLAVNAPLVAFWFVPRVRAVSLVAASVVCLGATILEPRAAGCLLGPGLAWVLVPLAERLEGLSSLASGRPLPATIPLAAGGSACAFGLVSFLGALTLLPPSAPLALDRETWAPLDPGPAQQPDLPLGELIVFAAGVFVVLLGLHLLSGRRRVVSEEPADETLWLAVKAPRKLAEASPTSPGAEWPAGPRARIVAAWRALEARQQEAGRSRPPGATPRRFAAGLNPAAQRLAEAFGAARWGPEPPDEVAAADAERWAREAGEG